MAEILGVNVKRVKLTAFVFTSLIIGVQGALYAYYTGAIQGDDFTLNLTISYIAIVIIGGQGSVLGTVFGSIVVVGLPLFLQNLSTSLPTFPGSDLVFGSNIFNTENVIYGALIMIFVLFSPYGLARIVTRMAEYVRSWPYSRSRAAR
jgi:branched-chain amino acid transport system permease protein